MSHSKIKMHKRCLMLLEFKAEHKQCVQINQKKIKEQPDHYLVKDWRENVTVAKRKIRTINKLYKMCLKVLNEN